MSDHIRIQLDVSKTTGQLAAVDRKVKKKTLRKATTSATKVIHKQARVLAPRVNGFFRMSLRVVVRMQKDGTVVGRVGQEKNKRFTRKKYKGSNLNQRGYAARVWWLEGGTKRHTITPSGKALAWSTGRRKGSKGQTRFAGRVNHPGARAQRILASAGRSSGSAAAEAFNSTVATELAQLPAPGDQS